MTVICVVLGLAVLVAMTGGGFILAHSLSGNQMIMSLLELTPASVYAVFVGACFVIGLLVCLSLVMSGLIYRKASFAAAWCDRHSKRHHLSRHAKDEVLDDMEN